MAPVVGRPVAAVAVRAAEFEDRIWSIGDSRRRAARGRQLGL